MASEKKQRSREELLAEITLLREQVADLEKEKAIRKARMALETVHSAE